MGAEIDRLEVQVEAQATKANNQLDKMITKLDRVASSLMHVNNGGLNALADGVTKFGQASTTLNSVRTSDFTRLAKNIKNISSINTKELYGASHAMRTLSNSINSLGNVSAASVQVSQIATGISKLGGVSVQRAITNLPQLATALKSFMSVMSNVPEVSRNTIKMVTALSQLSEQGSKVGSAVSGINGSLNNYGKVTDRATKKTRNLASVLGTLNANFFWIKNIAQKLYKFAGSSMDFLETVNYFEVAMRDIGNSAASQWKENGYASAEAYSESFSERAKQLTEKMTGYSIDSDGNASYLGIKNLGMDPDKVLQYQATYAQVSASMGVAEESALNFSKALTMLGADWASLRNLTFEQSWEKFASALAGQSRAIRSLGIDITNATLQEYAYKNGLDMAVSEMNQATKAQLRLLAILDQSKVAYGDLANTIESPSNQLRMLQQNASNLARVFGNLFVPVLEKALPIINGTTIALQNLFTWIGNMMGIKFESINSATGGMDENILDAVDGADDLEGALSDADNAAKKLKNTLQGWHEINNITSKDASSDKSINIGGNAVLDGAISSALEEYEKKWNEAFERMENKAQQYAEKFGKYLEPVKKIISDFTIGDYFQAGEDTSKLVSGIFNFLSKAIDGVDWEEIGAKVGDFLEGINWREVLDSVGKLVYETLKAAIEFWMGSFATNPLGTLALTFGALAFKVGGAALTSKLFSDSIGKAAGLTLTGNPYVFAIAATVTIGWSLKNMLNDKESWLRKKADEVYDTATYDGAEYDKKQFSEEANNFSWAENIKKNWEELKQGWKNLFKFSTKDYDYSLYSKTVGELLADGIYEGIKEEEPEVSKKSSNTIFDGIFKSLSIAFGIHSPAREMYPIGKNILLGVVEGFVTEAPTFSKTIEKWKKVVNSNFGVSQWTFEGVEKGLSASFTNAIEAVKSIWNNFANWLNGKLTFSWDSVNIAGVEIVKAGKIDLGKIPTFYTGGFAEDGLFMANHSELVGKFANGKTAIANNQQITEGIEEAAYRGVSRALAENPGGGTKLHIEGDPHGMFRVWLDEYNSEAERIQGNPIPIYN